MSESWTEKETRLRQELRDLGATKIIYSLVMPETEEAKRAVMGGDLKSEFERTVNSAGSSIDAEDLVQATERANASYFDQFRQAWTQKQDAMHDDFFNAWLEWARPIAQVAGEEFVFRYPTAGASEGLRAIVEEYGSRASRRDKYEPEIHIFGGEYEGYEAYAKAAYIPVRKHDRTRWEHAVEAIANASVNKEVQVYLSQPSAIDGDTWEHYDAFMQALAGNAPRARVILDLTYVGCITKQTKIRTDYPNIPVIVFSLSKPMGAYYDRIGGVLAKARTPNEEPYPALWGNKWFKNLTSLAFGREFMRRHHVYEMPRKYASVQQRAIAEFTRKIQARGHAITLRPADVFILATGELLRTPTEMSSYLERQGVGRLRVCLTPTMSELIGTGQALAPILELGR
jgi:hypothetical protein